MDKTMLSNKWSKYCNTDKLVDDAIELLTSTGNRCSEHGVCVLLDTYFTNKEPLIKLLMNSKHYAGDMRIIIEKEFDRKISLNTIRNFFASTNLNANFLLQFADSSGMTMYDHLVTGKKFIDIEHLPSQEEQQKKKEKISKFDPHSGATVNSKRMFDNYKSILNHFSYINLPALVNDIVVDENLTLARGTKTSRALNKVCHYYGTDKANPQTVTVNKDGEQVQKVVYPYDKEFAIYSDLVSECKKKMQFIISLNPLDYLTMSNGVSWHSCHNIVNGGWKGGTLSYMLDAVSMITFVVENINDEIHKIPKVYRQMYHYEDKLFIQNRLYPQENDGATNLYDKFRDFMIEEFTNLLHSSENWDVQVGPSPCTNHSLSAGKHYRDYRCNSNVSIFYPVENAVAIESQIMTIGHDGICVNCGKEYSNNGCLSHRYPYECEN